MWLKRIRKTFVRLLKKTIQIDGNTTNEFSGYRKISDIEEYLEEMKTKGYTHIDIIYDAGYEEVDFVPYLERLETDKEYEQRLSPSCRSN